jgi:hypothetical protein
MTTLITKLAQQAQATTTPDQQLENIILILQDALRRLQLLKT